MRWDSWALSEKSRRPSLEQYAVEGQFRAETFHQANSYDTFLVTRTN